MLKVSALSDTCRQLRHETLGLGLALNTYEGIAETLTTCIKYLSPDSRHLTSVTVIAYLMVVEIDGNLRTLLDSLSHLAGLRSIRLGAGMGDDALRP